MHEGKANNKSVDNRLYFETAKKLTEAITGTFNGSFSVTDNRNALQQRLMTNLYQFSGAKSLTQAALYSSMLADANGVLRTFPEFRREILKIHPTYNEQYLSAEYNTAVANAQVAEAWAQFDDEDWIQFSTAGDERVRAAHAALDGIVQVKTSNFWKRYTPPLAWNCRCHIIPASKPTGSISDPEKFNSQSYENRRNSVLTEVQASAIAKPSVTNPMFENNPGETGIIFKDDHPYFESHRGIKELDAVKNYGMKPVKTILKNTDDLPARKHADTETDYYTWWADQVKTHGINETDFAVTDKMGVQVLFESRGGKNADNYFRDHVIKKYDEARHEYAVNAVDMLRHPDEIWNKGDDYQYIRYFNDGMYVVTVINDGKTVRAVTMYKVENEARQKEIRKGVLLFKNKTGQY